jgi:hypothetical protein
LVDALVDAFDHGGMARLAGLGLGVPLGEVVSPDKSLPEIALNVIEWAEVQGLLAELDGAAKALNPGNALLRRWQPGPQVRRDSPYCGLFAFREIDADVFFSDRLSGG